MKTGWTRRIGILVVGLAFAAGTALAQAPDMEQEGNGGAAGAGRQAGAGAARGEGGRMGQGQRMNPEQVQAMRNMWQIMQIFGAENATIANTETGVDMAITAEGAEAIATLQKETTETITTFKEAVAERDAEAGEGPQMGNNLMGMLMTGRAQIEARNIETGVVVSVTSDDPDLVGAIQEQMPRFQERAAAQRQMRERITRQREVARLLANEDVTIETVETEKGLQLTIWSDDPELQAQLKDLLPKYLEDVKASGNRPQFERRMQGDDAEGADRGGRDRGNRGDRGDRGDRGNRGNRADGGGRAGRGGAEEGR